MNEESPKQINSLYDFGPFRLDATERRLSRDGEAVPLPRKAFDLLLILVEEAGHLKTREALIEALWPDTIVEEQGLTTKLHALRKALGDEGEAPIYIETVRGVGYRFMAPVTAQKTTVSAPAAPSATALQHPARAAARRHGIAVAALIVVIVAGLLVWRFLPSGETRASAHSIAVLPFESLSTDKKNAYFAAGIRDTILSQLAELNAFRVVSRSSSDAYPSHPGDLQKIGEELGISTILEGSVQKVGDRVMINVQLIDVNTDNHIWASSYTRKLDDIFAVESDVAANVAAALEHELAPEQRKQLAQAPTSDSQAYLLYLKGNYNARRAFAFANTDDPEATVAAATALYRQALARDPDFALAWAQLSLLDSKAYWYGIDTSPQRRSAAKEAAERALALAPDLALAHVARGYAYYYGELNYPAAVEQFQIARKSLPRDADVIGAMGFIHRRQGEWDKALSELEGAARLDARNPRWHIEIGITLMALRRYADAIMAFDAALALAPDSYDAKMRKIDSLMLSGNLPQAKRELATIPIGNNPQGFVAALRFNAALLSHQPGAALAVLNATHWDPIQPLRAIALALMGDSEHARQYFEQTRRSLRKELAKQPDDPDMWAALGLAEAGLGNRDTALEAVHHALELRPLSKDHLAAPYYLVMLAQIHAQLDERVAAVKLLKKLLAMPAGLAISVTLVRLSPYWNPLRSDPGFQALLKKYSSPAAATH